MKLDREEFRAWLASKEPDEVVGLVSVVSQCPGSEWLKAIGHPKTCVDYDHPAYEDAPVSGHLRSDVLALDQEPAPDWLAWFAYGIDDTADQGKGITAKEALTILDSLEVA